MNRWPTIQDIKNSKAAELNKHIMEEKAMAKKRSKFGNRKIEIDGYVFDSLKESRRYISLKSMQAYNEIDSLVVHPTFMLSVCKYLADFCYKQNGKLIVEDVKSRITRKLSTYRLKKKLMKEELGIEITEI